jgi:PAS domain S-box-containing protein
MNSGKGISMVTRSLQILIVEDEPAHAEAIRRAIEAAGLDAMIREAGTLREYREIVEAHPPQIALLDLNLPDGRAVEVLSSPPEGGAFPVLIMTSYGNEQLAVEAMKAGAMDYIVKSPEAFAAMPRTIERALREWNLLRDRKQAEETLQRSEQRYRLLVENTGEAIVVVQDGRARFVNRGPDWSGYTLEEYVSMPVMETIHPEDREVVTQRYLQKIGGDATPTRYTYRALEKSGRIHWIEVSSALIDWEGRPATLNLIRDITERKKTEEALRESEEKHRILLEESPDPIFSFTPEGRYRYANRAFANGVGKPVGEIIGKRIWDVFPQEEADKRFASLSLVFRTGEEKVIEACVPRADGDRYYMTTITPIKDATGEVVSAICSSKEITERKRMEKQLQDSLESLRKAVGVTVQVMVSAVETRDPYTSGHQIRSAGLARAIATEMGLPQEAIDGIRLAGSIHDIGKLSIPAEILSKPIKLTEIEFSLIQEHARQGFEILRGIESSWPLAETVYQHHERMDGSGYPRHLKGDEILIEARILAVADVVESMASHRPYRPALGIGPALEEIERNSGTLYDKTVADACLRLFREKNFQLERA